MWHMRLTQRCRWKFKSPGMWRCATGWTDAWRSFNSRELLTQWHSVTSHKTAVFRVHYPKMHMLDSSNSIRYTETVSSQIRNLKIKANVRNTLLSHNCAYSTAVCLTHLGYWQQLCRFHGLRGTAWLRNHQQCCWSVGEWTGNAPDETEVVQSLEAGLWSTPQSLL